MAETLRPQLPAGARIAVGMVVLLLGLGLIAIGLTPSMSATPGMGIVGVPAGLVFACGGVLVLLPERLGQLRLAGRPARVTGAPRREWASSACPPGWCSRAAACSCSCPSGWRSCGCRSPR